MKPLRAVAVLLLWLCCNYAKAQKENNIWTFGPGMGLDFTAGAPVLYTSEVDGYEGCASVCDASGALLFYSDGLKVIDRFHKIMPNGSGLLGDSSSTQGVAIAPVPFETGRYFLFTLDAQNTAKTGRLHYSLIDMSLNSGRGDVVPGFKNRLLGTHMSEKMVLAAACDKIWLITHDIDKPEFYAWPLTSSAVTPVPVTSVTPGLSTGGIYSMGEMKMSPDQQFLYKCDFASRIPDTIPRIERFDFDRTTGLFSNYLRLDSMQRAYSLEVSPDGSKLYVVDYYEHLYQYDLSLLPDLNAVRGSRVDVGGPYYYISVRRGPDKKIYALRAYAPDKITRINSPDLYSGACDRRVDISSLTSKNRKLYQLFGNSTVSLLPPEDTVFQRTDTTVCMGKTVTYSRDGSFKEMSWHDGSAAMERTFSEAGTYWRRSRKGCTIYVDTISLQLRIPDTLARKVLDTLLCFEPELQVSTGIPSDHYTWKDGSSGPVYAFHSSGVSWVSGRNRDEDCRQDIDTFSVTMIDFELGLSDTFLCRGQELHLEAATAGAEAYLWNDGSVQSSLHVDRDGQYWVKASAATCSKTDTIRVASHAFTFDLGPDHLLCAGGKVVLEPTVPGARYTWPDGSAGPVFTIADSGVHRVTAERDGCTERDSVSVAWVVCTNCIQIPNMFTPNNDATNDVFRALLRCPVRSYEMIIVNRYGEVLFTARQITDAWDGTFKGKPMDAGVYYFLVKVSFDFPGLDPREEVFKGDITLLR